MTRPPTSEAGAFGQQLPPRTGTSAPPISGGADAFIAKMKAERPEIAALIAADASSLPPVLADLPWQSRQAALMTFVSMTFSLEKESRHAEALLFARIQHAIASSDAPDRLDSFLGHTQPRNVGDTLCAIGEIQKVLGDYTEALATLLRAEACYQVDATLRKEAGLTKPSEFDHVFHLEDFRSLNLAAIADVYRQLGDESAYRDYTERAWHFSLRRADPMSQFNTLIARGAGAKERGDLDAALGAYFEAGELAPKLDTARLISRDVAEALTSIGVIYAELGLHRRALEFYNDARERNERSGHRGRLLLDHMNIARVHAARGAVAEAIDSYANALRCASVPARGERSPLGGSIWNCDGEIRQLVRLEDAWRIFLGMGRIHRPHSAVKALESLTQAVELVEQLRNRVLSDQQRVGYQAKVTDVYDEIIETLADIHEASPSRDTAEQLFQFIERSKARVLAELLADQPIPPPAAAPAELIEREGALLAELQQLEQALEAADETAELLERLTRANRALSETWAAIAAADPDAGPKYVALRRAEPSSCGAIRGSLNAAATARVAFVNFYVSPSRVISVTLFSDREDLHYAAHRIDREELRGLVLVDPNDPPPPELRLPYWELDFPIMTVAPIAQAVAGYDIVYLSPHDLLHSLPLHALRPTSSEPPFAERATLAYTPSAAVLGFCLRERTKNVGGNVVLGNPAVPQEAPIPHSEKEAIAVAELLGCEPLIRTAATRTAALDRGGRAEYLHFAGHCKFSRVDPMASALMFSDGNLTARDVLGWRLNTDLVAVSACESGVSKVAGGDEQLGLVRALLFAGSPAVMVSLWNAYDASAETMMRHFYDLRIKNRTPKAAALADAQRALIRAGTPAAQWASFVLIGDWR